MISLDARDARPIYEQVKEGLRHLMVAGAIQPGEKLPSVRALAASLAINPNTIQRAYEALEREGYVQAVPGKGCFAAKREHIGQERQKALLSLFDQAVEELLFLGVTAEVLYARLRQHVGKEAVQ